MTSAEPSGNGLVATLAEEGGVVVLRPVGDIDYPNAPALQEVLDRALASRPPRIVVDLRQTTFVDSTGLALLVNAFRHVAEYGGWLRIAGAGRQFRRLLKTTNLDRWLTPYPTPDAAAAGRTDGDASATPEI